MQRVVILDPESGAAAVEPRGGGAVLHAGAQRDVLGERREAIGAVLLCDVSQRPMPNQTI